MDKTISTSHADMHPNELSAEELIAQDVGARLPTGIMEKLIASLALLWSLFQLWIASPLPFIVGFGVMNDTERAPFTLALPCCLPSSFSPLLSVLHAIVFLSSTSCWV